MNPPAEALRVVFMGTAELACASLRALAHQPHITLAAVVTQPDRPKGRRLQLHPSAVKCVAQELDLPILQPARAREAKFLQELASLRLDLGVVAAYGQILPPAILNTPRLGCLNVHTSLLPKYRGAAPIQWALLNDDAETGVTLMKMDPGLDTGPILASEKTAIREEDDAIALHDRLAALGAELLVRTIPDYLKGRITPQPQAEEEASYARKITKEDGRLDWSQPARSLWNRIRGLVPWPGCYTHMPNDAQSALLKVWRSSVEPAGDGPPGRIIDAGPDGILVQCGEGALRLLEVQRQGGKRMSAEAFLSGHGLYPGDYLGEEITPGNVQ